MQETESGFFLIDKPLDWTSFQVVNKLKFLFKYGRKIKKIKIGHAGTLDPLATGLLIVCYGKMTKEISRFQDMKKVYTGTFQLGATTLSYDKEMEIDKEFPIDHITPDKVKEAALSLTGKQLQRPPIYSAKRIDGKRAYELAREGLEVKVKESEVEVFKFDAVLTKPDEVSFRIECSKGTYIRSIAYDFGNKLKSGAFLTSLRRTEIGEYNVDKAVSIEELEEQFKS